MTHEKTPVTPAIRMLRERNVEYTVHLYDYVEKGGTAVSSRALGVDEHDVIKTLIMEDDRGNPLVILMHGDREVSTKELARTAGCRSISSCAPEKARKFSGYMVGGTSPFGLRRPMPVFMESTICESSKIYINGGRRGFLVGIDPVEIVRLLSPVMVCVGVVP